MDNEPVKFLVVTNREVGQEEILRRVSRIPGVADPDVNLAEGSLTFRYTGEITDLPRLEQTLQMRGARFYLVNPARVVLAVAPRGRGANPQELSTRFYARHGARLVNVDGRAAEVYIDLESTCVCALVAAAGEVGFEAEPRSHVDVTLRFAGDGDLTQLMAAARRLGGVIRVKAGNNGQSLGILAAERLRERDLQRIVEEAGFTLEGAGGT